MNEWIKWLTVVGVLVVVILSVTVFDSGVVYNSQEEYNKGYVTGFLDGAEYQWIHLETSGHISYYPNITNIMERKGYDRFGEHHSIWDIAKEDGLKTTNETGFYYKLQYRILVKEPKNPQTQLTNFTYYLNISGEYTPMGKEEYDRSFVNTWYDATLSPPYVICNSDWECVEVREDKEGNIHFSSGWFRFEHAGWHNVKVVENKGVYIDGKLVFPIKEVKKKDENKCGR